MFNGGNGVSVADIAAVMGNRGYGGGMGYDGGWWALIILLALFGGDGFGGGLFNRGGSNATTTAIDASLQRGFDNQSVISKLDGITNGICNLGYDQLAQMNTINTNIMQTGNGITNAIAQASVANMQQGNALTSQIQTCCCNIENLLAQANYNRATDTCTITTAIKDAVTQITANCNNNYRQLYDQQIALQMQGKDARIAELTAALNKCDSQAIATNAVNCAVAQLKDPAPVAAYVVPNPNAVYYNGNWGWNNGCGCNNGFSFAS